MKDHVINLYKILISKFMIFEIVDDKDYNTYDRNLKFKYDNYEFV